MEASLYERDGHPVAYISDDGENTIYTWDGHAVCYIKDDKIFGWRGHHIGWYIRGIIYDTCGNRVGYTKQTCPRVTFINPIKSIKHIKYVKYVRYIPHVRPVLKSTAANITLNEFIQQDAI